MSHLSLKASFSFLSKNLTWHYPDYSLGRVCQERNIMDVCLDEGYISNLYLHKHCYCTSHFIQNHSMELIIDENHYTNNKTSFPLKLSMYECMISSGVDEWYTTKHWIKLNRNKVITKKHPRAWVQRKRVLNSGAGWTKHTFTINLSEILCQNWLNLCLHSATR